MASSQVEMSAATIATLRTLMREELIHDLGRSMSKLHTALSAERAARAQREKRGARLKKIHTPQSQTATSPITQLQLSVVLARPENSSNMCLQTLVCLMFTQPAQIQTLHWHNSPTHGKYHNVFGCRNAMTTCSGARCGPQETSQQEKVGAAELQPKSRSS